MTLVLLRFCNKNCSCLNLVSPDPRFHSLVTAGSHSGRYIRILIHLVEMRKLGLPGPVIGCRLLHKGDSQRGFIAEGCLLAAFLAAEGINLLFLKGNLGNTHHSVLCADAWVPIGAGSDVSVYDPDMYSCWLRMM